MASSARSFTPRPTARSGFGTLGCWGYVVCQIFVGGESLFGHSVHRSRRKPQTKSCTKYFVHRPPSTEIYQLVHLDLGVSCLATITGWNTCSRLGGGGSSPLLASIRIQRLDLNWLLSSSQARILAKNEQLADQPHKADELHGQWPGNDHQLGRSCRMYLSLNLIRRDYQPESITHIESIYLCTL